MASRGTYAFETGNSGNVLDKHENLERLRKLLTDGEIINQQWGPGRDANDFLHGTWHVGCHITAGAGVYTHASGTLWVGITHKGAPDEYQASLVHKLSDGSTEILALTSQQAETLIAASTLLGYVEGASQGRILAQGVTDPRTAWNGWPRQDFNAATDDDQSPGGPVWELWCPTRDVRTSNQTGSSLISAYLTLVSVVGGQFVAAVARGRTSYYHPVHLAAMVKAGLVTRDEALWDTTPVQIPTDVKLTLHEATPKSMFDGADRLAWDAAGGARRYYMFERRIGSWSSVAAARSEIDNLA